MEHLLDVSTSIDSANGDIWEVCYGFMEHLFWHKPRLIMLGSKIETLADGHHSKSKCLSGLARLLGRIGNSVEQNRLLTHALELERQQRITLGFLKH